MLASGTIAPRETAVISSFGQSPQVEGWNFGIHPRCPAEHMGKDQLSKEESGAVASVPRKL
jgi:hypothetical protein